jgi:hypothetical protein
MIHHPTSSTQILEVPSDSPSPQSAQNTPTQEGTNGANDYGRLSPLALTLQSFDSLRPHLFSPAQPLRVVENEQGLLSPLTLTLLSFDFSPAQPLCVVENEQGLLSPLTLTLLSFDLSAPVQLSSVGNGNDQLSPLPLTLRSFDTEGGSEEENSR